MELLEYFDFVRAKLQTAQDEANKDEFIRLLLVVKDVIEDSLLKLEKE